MSRFLRFAVIGGCGFVVDAAVLGALLTQTPLGAFSARVVSICVALFATWMLNRSWTFGPSSRHVMVEGARYGGIGLASAVVNYLAYSAALLAAPMLPVFAALVIGSLVAMGFSFLGYSRLVFDR